MADWVHCNLCIRQLSGDVKFYLSTCSHIFCDSCRSKATNPHCAICHTTCQVKELNDELDQHLRAYFMTPESQIKKQVEVLKFQAHHRSILLKQLRRKVEGHSKTMKQVEEHYLRLKQENDSLRKRLQSVEEVNKQLTHDNSLLKKYIKAHESDNLIQMPVTPRQLVHSPSVVSPLVQYCNGRQQSPLFCSNRGGLKTVVSPATPMSASRNSGALGCLGDIQNTPNIDRMSVRQPPSRGRMGTPPVRQCVRSLYPDQVSSPIVRIDSPNSVIVGKVKSNSMDLSSATNNLSDLVNSKFPGFSKIAAHSEGPHNNAVKFLSGQSGNVIKRNFQSPHQVAENTSAIFDPSNIRRPSVSSKYFARGNPTLPRTSASTMRPSPR